MSEKKNNSNDINNNNNTLNNKNNISSSNNNENNNENSPFKDNNSVLSNDNDISSKASSSKGSRPSSSETNESKNDSTSADNNVNNSKDSNQKAEILYNINSLEDVSDINGINEITKPFNTKSHENLSKLNNEMQNSIDNDLYVERNIKTIVRDLSGFLNTKSIEKLDKEPVKSIGDIIEEINEDDQTNLEKIVEKIKNEYIRISSILVDTRINEKSLYNKCVDLSRFLNSCIIKVQSVLSASKNDKINIINLKLELEKAWTRIEEEENNKDVLRDTLDLLKKEIVKYRKRVRTKLDNLPDNLIDEYEIPESELKNADFIKEMEDKITNLTNQITKQNQEILKLEGDSSKKEVDYMLMSDKNKELTDQITELHGNFAKMKLEKERETREKRKVETQLKKLNETIEEKDKDSERKDIELSSCKDMIEKYKDELSMEQIKCKNSIQEKECIEETANRQQTELDEQNVKINLLVTENYKNESIIRKLESQINSFQNKYEKLMRVNEQLIKKQKMLEECIASKDEEEENLNKQIESLHKAEEEKAKEFEQMKKRIGELTREREILSKNYIRSLNSNNKQNGIIKTNEQTLKNTEREIQSYRDEASKMRKIIFALEKERDLQVMIQSNVKNELNEKLTYINSLKRKINEGRKNYKLLEKKYEDCIKLYEEIKADRNNYSKKLLDSNEEILELKRKYNSNSHSIDNMKEEVKMKDIAIAKTHFEKIKLEKEKEYLLNQISSQQNELQDNKMFIKNMQSSEENMRNTLIKMEKERKNLIHDYENIVKERDLMQNQIILRNDEIVLLYEKLKLLNSALTKGEFFYNERIEDIRVLKLEVKKLRREKSVLSTEAKINMDLRKEILDLKNQAIVNDTKMKVLEDELSNPLNIHRWRKLSGSDPESYELILKIQTLQRLLIKKTEDLIQKEQELKDKDILYEKLKKILQRQPGIKTMEQLRYYRDSLKSKINESKSLASELNMYHAQIEDYKIEIVRLNGEIQHHKVKYYNQKKKYENLSRKCEKNNKIRSYPIKRRKNLYPDINKVNSGALAKV